LFLRTPTTESNVVFVVELVLFVEGDGFVEFGDDGGHDLEEVPHDPVVGYLEDRLRELSSKPAIAQV
jgi:hypothetical protein